MESRILSCPRTCTIELRHVHEQDNEWPHISMVAHRGYVEFAMDDGHQAAWHTLDPETATCLAYEILETVDEAALQPKKERTRANS